MVPSHRARSRNPQRSFDPSGDGPYALLTKWTKSLALVLLGHLSADPVLAHRSAVPSSIGEKEDWLMDPRFERRTIRGTRLMLAGATLLVSLALAGPLPPAVAQLTSADCDFNNDRRADLAVGIPGDSTGGVFDTGSVVVMYGITGGLSPNGSQQWQQGVAGVPEVGEPGDQFGAALACGDFDNNRFDDLAIGVPGQDDGADRDIGAVIVLYGSASGLSATGSQVLTQDSSGIADDADARDRFGGALAAGDFDGDGRADLAVGVVGEQVGTDSNAEFEGAVNVIYGSPSGLDPANELLWTQDVPGVEGVAEPRDIFGAALAAGDLNGDGIKDLAIGAPGEDVGTISGAGTVNVLYGSSDGLAVAANKLFNQDTDGVADTAQSRDLFGSALAIADFDGNGRGDLAVGVPGEDVGTTHPSADGAGAVAVLYGTAAGLTAQGNDFWHQGSAAAWGGAQRGNHFGDALAGGDFDGDGHSDLAVGIPWDTVANHTGAGAVGTLYGAAGGLEPLRGEFWHQDADLRGVVEDDDHFGETLTVGDFSGNNRADLAIGTPGEDAGGVDTGSVSVLFGASGGGLGTADNQLWYQGSEGMAGDNEPFDRMSGRLRSTGTTGSRTKTALRYG